MQEISNPFGVTVFGSATVRVEPDIAVIHFSISRVRPEAKDAFEAIREASQQIQTFIRNTKLADAGSSQISLKEEFDQKTGEIKFVGYRTRVEFRVLLSDLDYMETLLTSLIDIGITNIASVSFQTTRLKQIRAEARQKAMAAAHEKAELYCAAAGVKLGSVLHIEDTNPQQLEGYRGHGQAETSLEDEGQAGAFNPGSIVVAGAVRVVYKFQE